MNRLMGVIHNGKHTTTLEELSQYRSLCSVPYGGRYRLIDFVLSNMVHSRISNVSIFPYSNFRSLMDHLGSGKEWDLDRKHDGLFILPPPTHANFLKNQNLASFYHHLDYFERSSQPYVVLASSYVVCQIDYEQVLDYHLEKEADITLVYKHFTDEEKRRRLQYTLDLDGEGRVLRIVDHPEKQTPFSFLDMIIMKRELLIECIERSVRENTLTLVKDIIIPRLEKFRVAGYEHHGYTAVINSVKGYYQHSMELLEPEIRKGLFYAENRPVYTKVKDEPPTRYLSSAKVKNSLVANGCVIEGAVENSILFRGVRIKRGAVVRNSIILQKSVVNEDAQLDNVILDKDVRILAGRTIAGTLNHPDIIAKRLVR